MTVLASILASLLSAADGTGFDHPSWLTAAATVAGYLLILVVLFLALFVVPYLVFAAV